MQAFVHSLSRSMPTDMLKPLYRAILQRSPETICPDCQSVDVRRLDREGFLERLVLPRLGLFPWECPACRNRIYLARRGRSRRTRSAHSA